MKRIFPRYSSSFECDYALEEAQNRIKKTVSSELKRFEIIEENPEDPYHIVLASSTGIYLYRNSFMPIVSIDMKESNGKTKFNMLFELRTSVKLFVIVYTAFLLFLEILFLAVMPVAFAAPIIIGIFAYVLSITGLRSASKQVLKILFLSLSDERAENIPTINKV